MGKNIPNGRNMFQVAPHYTNIVHFKALQNLLTLGFENVPSGNPILPIPQTS
jgi:hypothetical protein